MAADIDQLRELIRLAETHQAKLASALVKLENRIADIMATAPLRDGELFDLEWAVQARVVLREAIEQEYLTVVDGLVRQYNDVAAKAIAMLGQYGDIANLDASIIQQLQSLTFKGFEDLGQQYLDVIAKEVYESTLTGTPFAASVATIRATVGSDLGRYASQQLHDALMQFDAAVNTRVALEAGAEKFKYQGPDDEVTRDFCEKHVGKTYTKEEIEEIWSGSWAGKIDGNPFIVRGGYNCRHRFRAVF